MSSLRNEYLLAVKLFFSSGNLISHQPVNISFANHFRVGIEAIKSKSIERA
jgi:hypothetical protein